MKSKITMLFISLLSVIGLKSFGQGYLPFSLTSGVDLDVRCQTVYNNDLYVGGNFTTAGGGSANCIAKWNGSSWSSIGTGVSGGSSPRVMTMAVYNSELYVAGAFTTAGGVAVSGIAKFNGTNWSDVGTGFGGTLAHGYSMAVYNGELYVGGAFLTAGGVTCNGIAKWNGSTWSSLGGAGLGGTSSYGLALAVYSNNLYIGGIFTSAGGLNAPGIAKWNGSNWSTLGTGLGGSAQGRSLAVYNNELYVGGAFSSAGGVSTTSIAKWNGSTWSAAAGIGTSTYGSVYSMTIFNNDLFVGGAFSSLGGVNVSSISKWNGNTWSEIVGGIAGQVNSMVEYNSALYVGGSFTSAFGISANQIVKIRLITEPTIASSSIQFPAISNDSLSLSWINGNGSKHLVVVKAASAVSQNPIDLTTYSINNAFGTGSDLGSGNYVVYGGTGNTVTVKNLSPDIVYHFAIYEYNDSTLTGYENYLTTSFATANHTTIALEPTVPTGNFSFSNVTLTDMTVTVAPGNGSHRIIIAKQNSFVNNTAFVDTMGYAANSVFGSGTAQGTGNYIVYNGTGTTFSLSGLAANTSYYFASYEYNGTIPAANNYLLATPATGMQGSLNSEPTLQPTAITFTNITDNSMSLSWTNGDGINRIVIARSSTVNAAPEDGVEYTANSVFASGDDLGLNNYIVYSGTSNTFNLSGLTANTTYYFAIYEYNGTNTSNNYLMPAPATAFKSTLFLEPITPASNLTLSPITNGITTVNWTNGSGSNRVVVVRQGLALNELPDDGNGYTANSTFTSGTDLGSANYICFNGNTNSFNLQGLNPANVYYVGVIEYNGSGTSANYLTSSFPIANNLPASPTIAASALNITANSNSSAMVSWTNGNGQYRLLIVKANSPVDETPLDGSIYAANASFSSGAQLGTGNYTVYNGTANNTIVTNLDSNITYYFALFEFNKDGAGPTNYLETPSLTGNYNLITGLGIDEITEQFSFVVYPNPTTGIFSIKHQNIHQQMNVEVYNMLGEKVLPQQNTNEINLSASPKGVYFVRIYDDTKSYTTKISVE